jgi:hypothetical protein
MLLVINLSILLHDANSRLVFLTCEGGPERLAGIRGLRPANKRIQRLHVLNLDLIVVMSEL